MLRELQNIVGTPANGMFKAEVAMVTGMGVVPNETTKKVGLPTAETAEVVVVNKDRRYAKGVYASLNSDMPDYDTHFTNIEANDPVKFKTYLAGEVIATDQFVATGLAVGSAMSVGTDGKWKKATASTVPSRFVYTGTITDCGKTLARIKVVSTPVTNA